MKNFKVIVLVIFITSFIVNSPIEVLALQSNKRKNDDKRIIEICDEVRTTPVDEEELLKLIREGLDKEDAEFYIRLDEIVERLEQCDLEVILDNSIEDITDKDFRNNKEYYRNQILKGDKVALKKAFKSLKNIFSGEEYTEKVINTFANKSAYEIIYPDGSKITYNTKNSQRENLNREKNIKKPVMSNQGYEEILMEEGVSYAYGKVEAKEAEWSFESELSYSKVYLYTEFLLGTDKISKINYARGGQSSYGVVNIANSTGATISRTYSEGKEIPAEARNEVIFTVTGSFGASFLILSIGANPGYNWTQYIIFRLYEVEKIDDKYGAHYKWYAAEFK
ncbi:hypothetical protein [Clostridium sulfidigenes]|uniref:hypothetical protein n=1 Tax=Clostridium sulfidigenes TaxID=318464 RepID=UPI003F8BBFFF